MGPISNQGLKVFHGLAENRAIGIVESDQREENIMTSKYDFPAVELSVAADHNKLTTAQPKARRISFHPEAMIAVSSSLRVKTQVKAGGWGRNHNQAMATTATNGL